MQRISKADMNLQTKAVRVDSNMLRISSLSSCVKRTLLLVQLPAQCSLAHSPELHHSKQHLLLHFLSLGACLSRSADFAPNLLCAFHLAHESVFVLLVMKDYRRKPRQFCDHHKHYFALLSNFHFSFRMVSGRVSGSCRLSGVVRVDSSVCFRCPVSFLALVMEGCLWSSVVCVYEFLKEVSVVVFIFLLSL